MVKVLTAPVTPLYTRLLWTGTNWPGVQVQVQEQVQEQEQVLVQVLVKV